MPGLQYRLVCCHKCGGELYGPVGLTVVSTENLELEIKKAEKEVCSSHPQHVVNGHVLKRYSDVRLPY